MEWITGVVVFGIIFYVGGRVQDKFDGLEDRVANLEEDMKELYSKGK